MDIFLILVSVLFCALLGFLLLNWLYKRTNAYKNQLVTIKGYLDGVPDNLKLACFGSTYAKFAFNALDELNIQGFNFSLDAECLQCDRKLLELYGGKLSPGCIVVFGLAACIACCKEEEIVVFNYRQYFHVLDHKRLPRKLAHSIKYRLGYYLPLAQNIKRAIRIFFDVPHIKDVMERYPAYCSALQAQTNMKSMAQGWIKLFHLQDLRQTNLSEENNKQINANAITLTEMIEYSRKMNWKPVIVIIPSSAELNGHFSDQFVDATLMKMVHKVEKATGVCVLDYRKDQAFQHDSSLFVDGGFRMSEYGSVKFIRQLTRDLNEKGFVLNNKSIARAI